MGERIPSLDIIKAIAILSVVLGHIGTPLGTFVFSWHMPVFFFLSGILMCVKKQQSGDNYRKNLWSSRDFLYFGKFYLGFGCLGVIIECLKIVALGRTPLDVRETILGLFFYMDMQHLHHYGFILWFLPALFWAKWFMRLLLRVRFVCFQVVVGFCLYLIAIHFMPVVWFGIRGGMMGCIWVLLGYGYWENLHHSGWCDYWGVLLGIVFLLLCVPIPHLNMAIFEASSPCYNLLYSCAVIFALMLWSRHVSVMIGKWIVIERLARYSIYIMALHVYTNNIADQIANRFLGALWEAKFILSLLLLAGMYYILYEVRKRFRHTFNHRCSR